MSGVFDSDSGDDKNAERLYVFWRDAAQRNFQRNNPGRILPDTLMLPWGMLSESERDCWRVAQVAFSHASKMFSF